MKIRNRILAVVAATAALALSNSARADHDIDLYRANEVSFDLFGTGSINQQTIDQISGDRIRDNGRLGAGLGVNYFFLRNVGVGMDAYTEDANHYLVDNASANLILRFPIGHSGFSPYIYGGATRQFDPVRQWAGDAGGGLEYRFHRHWGVFVDARYVMADRTDNFGVGRAGLRIAF